MIIGLRTKFNLLLIGVAVVGIGLFALASAPLLDRVAKDEVLQSSRIMMESAAGARKYTSDQIAPLLAQGGADRKGEFHPQTVSAYAAKKTFDVLHARFPDYSYREAALNPTNPEDRAMDWEADIINDFRAHPDRREIVSERETPMGRMLNLARPIVNEPACLECHSVPSAAPRSMIALYGRQNGFGWRPGDIIGAQIVSAPISVAVARADGVRASFILPVLAIFLVLIVILNVMLSFLVIAPIDRMTKTAEAVSLGEPAVPEYVREGTDQVARLSAAFNRMRRSLEEALRLLGDR